MLRTAAAAALLLLWGAAVGAGRMMGEQGGVRDLPQPGSLGGLALGGAQAQPRLRKQELGAVSTAVDPLEEAEDEEEDKTIAQASPAPQGSSPYGMHVPRRALAMMQWRTERQGSPAACERTARPPPPAAPATDPSRCGHPCRSFWTRS